jgi:hypothetical protein
MRSIANIHTGTSILQVPGKTANLPELEFTVELPAGSGHFANARNLLWWDDDAPV